MPDIVLDIETVAFPFENYDDVQKAYLLKFAEQEDTAEKRTKKREEIIQNLALHPFTAQVITIGLLNVQSNKAEIYYIAEEQRTLIDENGNKFVSETTEEEILNHFWKIVGKKNKGEKYVYENIVTFNGRGFDCPFLLVRSAINKIKPTRNIMPSRFDFKQGCDLLDQFTFYGSLRRFNFDFICKVFNIKSPKSEMTGLEVAKLFAEKQYQKIAKYCLGDLHATAELFNIWNSFLNFQKMYE